MVLHHYFSKFPLESGTDEAGRGCLAGPVTAAAVILPEDFENIILNNSKQLSEKTREKLRPIIESQAIWFASLKLKCLALNPNSGRDEKEFRLYHKVL